MTSGNYSAYLQALSTTRNSLGKGPFSHYYGFHVATRANGRYRGTVTLKQRDFGIMPISIAGGTVKVKDEIKIEFDVVAR